MKNVCEVCQKVLELMTPKLWHGIELKYPGYITAIELVEHSSWVSISTQLYDLLPGDYPIPSEAKLQIVQDLIKKLSPLRLVELDCGRAWQLVTLLDGTESLSGYRFKLTGDNEFPELLRHKYKIGDWVWILDRWSKVSALRVSGSSYFVCGESVEYQEDRITDQPKLTDVFDSPKEFLLEYLKDESTYKVYRKIGVLTINEIYSACYLWGTVGKAFLQDHTIRKVK